MNFSAIKLSDLRGAEQSQALEFLKAIAAQEGAPDAIDTKQEYFEAYKLLNGIVMGEGMGEPAALRPLQKRIGEALVADQIGVNLSEIEEGGQRGLTAWHEGKFYYAKNSQTGRGADVYIVDGLNKTAKKIEGLSYKGILHESFEVEKFLEAGGDLFVLMRGRRLFRLDKSADDFKQVDRDIKGGCKPGEKGEVSFDSVLLGPEGKIYFTDTLMIGAGVGVFSRGDNQVHLLMGSPKVPLGKPIQYEEGRFYVRLRSSPDIKGAIEVKSVDTKNAKLIPYSAADVCR